MKLMVGLLVVTYLLPTFIAKFRNHLNGWAVLWVNVFFGWTIVGWVVALLWAVAPIEAYRIIENLIDNGYRDAARCFWILIGAAAVWSWIITTAYLAFVWLKTKV
jgi:hypothetical protein